MPQLLIIEAKAKELTLDWDRESKAGRLTNEQRVRKLLQAAELLDNSQT